VVSERVRLVINRYDRRFHNGRAEIEWALGVPAAALIPQDQTGVQRAIAAQRPVVLDAGSRAGRALLELAERLHAGRLTLAPEVQGQRRWGRLGSRIGQRLGQRFRPAPPPRTAPQALPQSRTTAPVALIDPGANRHVAAALLADLAPAEMAETTHNANATHNAGTAVPAGAANLREGAAARTATHERNEVA
jgi:hypothetical protein